MTARLRPLTLGLLVAIGAGCSTPHAEKVHERPRPIRVETIVVEERPVPNTVLLAGSLKANQESELAANASGRVLRTMVERGSYVSRGSPIAQLDTRMAALTATEAEAQVESARTQKKHAEDECARYERLFRRGIVTQQEYDRQATNCKTAATSTAAAETRVELTRQTVNDGTIRAPFPGLVSERYVSTGEYVMPATRVVHIVDIDPLRLELTIPEQNMSAVRKGQSVAFQVSAFPDHIFRGVVHHIGPAVRATTRDLVFEAIVPNKDKLLRPGLFATAHIDAGLRNLPLVPKTALKQDGDTTRAFVVIDRHIEERVLHTEPPHGDLVPVPKGLAAGERLVMRPGAEVVDGAEVE